MANPMELRRVRFLELVPSAIRFLRFSEDATRPKLAVARTNGSIEVSKHIVSCVGLPSFLSFFLGRSCVGMVYGRWTSVLPGCVDSWADGLLSRVVALV